MTVRNRVVMPPVETMYGTPDGLPSQRTHDYFAARLKGGVGLITLGAPGVDDHHPETPGGLHLATDDAVDAHRALVEVDVVRAAPDAVLVATGGHVAVPAIPGADLPHVHTGPGLREFLGGHAESTDPAWQRLGVRCWPAGGSGWSAPPRFASPPAPGCRSAAESQSSAATWSLWN